MVSCVSSESSDGVVDSSELLDELFGDSTEWPAAIDGKDWQLETETARLNKKGELAIQSTAIDGKANLKAFKLVFNPGATYAFKGNVQITNGEPDDRLHVLVHFSDGSIKDLEIKPDAQGNFQEKFQVPEGKKVDSFTLENLRTYGRSEDTATFSGLEIAEDGSGGKDIPSSALDLLKDPALKSLFMDDPNYKRLIQIATQDFPGEHQKYQTAKTPAEKLAAYQKERELFAEFNQKRGVVASDFAATLGRYSGAEKILQKYHCTIADLPAIAQDIAEDLKVPDAPHCDPKPQTSSAGFIGNDSIDETLTNDPVYKQLVTSLKDLSTSNPALYQHLKAYQSLKEQDAPYAQQLAAYQSVATEFTQQKESILGKLVQEVHIAPAGSSLATYGEQFKTDDALKAALWKELTGMDTDGTFTKTGILSTGVPFGNVMPPPPPLESYLKNGHFNENTQFFPEADKEQPGVWYTNNSSSITKSSTGGPFESQGSITIKGPTDPVHKNDSNEVTQTVQVTGKVGDKVWVRVWVKNDPSTSAANILIDGDRKYNYNWTISEDRTDWRPVMIPVTLNKKDEDASGQFTLHVTLSTGLGGNASFSDLSVSPDSKDIEASIQAARGNWENPSSVAPWSSWTPLRAAFPQHKSAYEQGENLFYGIHDHLPGWSLKNGSASPYMDTNGKIGYLNGQRAIDLNASQGTAVATFYANGTALPAGQQFQASMMVDVPAGSQDVDLRKVLSFNYNDPVTGQKVQVPIDNQVLKVGDDGHGGTLYKVVGTFTPPESVNVGVQIMNWKAEPGQNKDMIVYDPQLQPTDKSTYDQINKMHQIYDPKSWCNQGQSRDWNFGDYNPLNPNPSDPKAYDWERKQISNSAANSNPNFVDYEKDPSDGKGAVVLTNQDVGKDAKGNPVRQAGGLISNFTVHGAYTFGYSFKLTDKSGNPLSKVDPNYCTSLSGWLYGKNDDRTGDVDEMDVPEANDTRVPKGQRPQDSARGTIYNGSTLTGKDHFTQVVDLKKEYGIDLADGQYHTFKTVVDPSSPGHQGLVQVFLDGKHIKEWDPPAHYVPNRDAAIPMQANIQNEWSRPKADGGDGWSPPDDGVATKMWVRNVSIQQDGTPNPNVQKLDYAYTTPGEWDPTGYQALGYAPSGQELLGVETMPIKL